MGKMCVALASLLSFCSGVLAQDKPLAFVGAKIIIIDGANIEEGVLVVHQGRITAVGAAGATVIPDDAQRIDSLSAIVVRDTQRDRVVSGRPVGMTGGDPGRVCTVAKIPVIGIDGPIDIARA